MDYKRTVKPSELDGKRFSYGDFDFVYNQNDVIRTDLVEIEGYSHTAITFNGHILYYRETGTYLYYFINSEGIGNRYKNVYINSNDNSNYYNNGVTVSSVFGNIVAYFEFKNSLCEGYGYITSESKVFIPIKTSNINIPMEYVNMDYLSIRKHITVVKSINRDTKIYINKTFNYTDVEVEPICFNIFDEISDCIDDIKEISRINGTTYVVVKDKKYYVESLLKSRNGTLVNVAFLTPLEVLPKERIIIFTKELTQKRTNGVTDVVNDMTGFFEW